MLNGHPVITVTVGGNEVPYPAFYGQACGKQPEPFSSSCYNTTNDPPTELPEGVRASWCDDPWCYVDPCTCALSDVVKTEYFPGVDIYYTYSNCGGVDTFSTNNIAADCNTSFTATSDAACLTKFSNGAARVNCGSGNMDLAVNGKCVRATVGDTVYDYPATYGEGCGVHLEPGWAACQTDPPASWCLDPWSYVNPCSCDADDLVPATYFPDGTAALYYSYSVCGATDSYTAQAGLNATELQSAGCPSPAPPAVSPANWPNTHVDTPVCACIPLDAAHLVSCTGDIAQGGTQCANSSGGLLTANYGGSCGVHAELNDDHCYKDADTMWDGPCIMPWDDGCRAGYCDRPWCYIDPCSCNVSDIASSVRFEGSTLYYSYETCGAMDTFSQSNGIDGSTLSQCGGTDGTDGTANDDTTAGGAHAVKAAFAIFSVLLVAASS